MLFYKSHYFKFNHNEYKKTEAYKMIWAQQKKIHDFDFFCHGIMSKTPIKTDISDLGLGFLKLSNFCDECQVAYG